MAEQAATVSLSLVDGLCDRYQEPEWLRSARQAAFARFVALPSPRLEKTDLTRRVWNAGPFPAAVGTDGLDEVAGLLSALGDAPAVVVRDGVVLRAHLPADLARRGVIFTDLHTAVRDHENLVQAALFQAVDAEESKWAAFNAALWHGGVFLYVPRHVEIDAVFQFVYIHTAVGQGALPRALVVAEDNAKFAYSELYVAAGDVPGDVVHSGVTEVIARPGARVTAAVLSHLRKGPTHFITRRAKVDKDAHVDWVFGDVGDGFTVALIESRLLGDGSRSTLTGVGLGFGRQHLDLTASMVHSGRYSESDMNLRGVVRERANAVYRTRTHIVKGARGAGAEQADRMLVLDPTARADAIPMLLIDENNVQRCGHAASVGKIDENQVYYLMSRGIPRAAAQRMILWGYLEPAVNAIPSPAMREHFRALLDKELV
ncbi:FeS cluster assembly protein SufD [Alicyclobacillus cellulosilyticus]|uniref:FeS cluster assembly protein SufD n=1 Tax=Alicyclobacillus cellulosilyticus TaxID=1003997 RepID=A0A917K4J6_9BACL|nr:SufD family Fe-S cluster assembly protein [Alicyclobacillus cellulosilyticus]GGI98758.1 FeS cluster assembly protein SufD [Alicyclobacillus cellulosilyticus]